MIGKSWEADQEKNQDCEVIPEGKHQIPCEKEGGSIEHREVWGLEGANAKQGKPGFELKGGDREQSQNVL